MPAPGPFARPVTKAHLALPLVLFAVAAADAVSGPWVNRASLAMFLLLNVFFLNAFHAWLTASMTLGLPEGRAWLRSQGGAAFWAVAAALAGVFFTLTAGARYGLSVPDEPLWFLIYCAIALVHSVAGVHHGLYQSYGLSVLFGAGAPSDEARERAERRDFAALCAVDSCVRLLWWIALAPMRPIHVPAGPRWAAAALCLFFVARIVARSRAASGRWDERTIHLLRLFLRPLMPFTPLALLGSKLVHNAEYAIVWDRVLERSKGRSGSRAHVAVIAALGLPVLATLVFMGSPHLLAPGLLPWAVSGVATTILLHYAVDYGLFRFSRSREPGPASLLLRRSEEPVVLEREVRPARDHEMVQHGYSKQLA